MATTAGANENATLITIIKGVLGSPGNILKGLMVIFKLIKYIFNHNTQTGFDLAGSFASLLTGLTNSLITQLLFAIPAVSTWVAEKLVEEEAEEAIPYVGWAFKIVANAAAAVDMAATTAEYCALPYVIENTISLAHQVTVTVKKDPLDSQFPRAATSVVLSVYAGKNPVTLTKKLTDTDLAKSSLTFVVNGVPATAKTEKVVAVFYDDVTDSPGFGITLGYGEGTILNKIVDGKTPITSFEIKENPVPINANTKFEHKFKLTKADGKYAWDDKAAKPVYEALDTGGKEGTLNELNNITLWVPGGMLGYSWRAASKGMKECGGDGSGSLYMFNNVNTVMGKEDIGQKFSGCGFSHPMAMAYDMTALGDQAGGRHFYLDAYNTDPKIPQYHLRKITLDQNNDLNVWSLNKEKDKSWGMFTMPINRMAVTHNGYVIGISSEWHRIGVCSLEVKGKITIPCSTPRWPSP